MKLKDKRSGSILHVISETTCQSLLETGNYEIYESNKEKASKGTKRAKGKKTDERENN